MAEMVERVARVLYPQNFRHEPTDDFARKVQEYSLTQAPVAIAAMREAPKEVLMAGFEAEATANPHKVQPHHVVPAIWKAMIDAALKGNGA